MTELQPDTTHDLPRPCPSWCRADHQPGQARVHARRLYEVTQPTLVSASLLQGELADGALTHPVVRIFYDIGAQTRLLDITPQVAEDFGNVLTRLDYRQLADFAAALGRPYRLATAP